MSMHEKLGHLYIMESFMCALYANEGMNNYNLKPPNAGTITSKVHHISLPVAVFSQYMCH